MTMVNLGCGSCYNAAWINFDSVPCSSDVRWCDLRKPLPILSGSVDVVYHSHVLEHLTANEGRGLLHECHRILRPGGILRVVVPDLEGIARAYLSSLNIAAAGGDSTLHVWMRMELTDQLARSTPGGEMVRWLQGMNPAELAQVRTRFGKELDNILRPPLAARPWRQRITVAKAIGKLRAMVLRALVRVIGGMNARTALDEGIFRCGGEIHRIMFDRLSLERLLLECGFVEPRVTSAAASRIAYFNDYELDVADGEVRKPDSLFMEAMHP